MSTSTAENNIQSGVTDGNRDLLELLLESLVATTASDYAIFRTAKPQSDKLVLECAVEHPNLHLLESGRICIPAEKDASCWSMHPFDTWGAAAVDTISVNDSELTPEERFINAIIFKAWFPVELKDGTTGLVIVVRTSFGLTKQPYRYREIVDAWVNFQSF